MAAQSVQTREAPPLRPPKRGLLPAAAVVEPSTEYRWGFGLTWLPEMPVSAAHPFGAVAVRDAQTGLSRTAADKSTAEVAYPFGVYAIDWTTVFDADTDTAARAERRLRATRSWSIGHELWYGTIAQAAGLANVWLSKNTSTTVTAAAISAKRALAKLDGYLADVLRNGPGMVHCSVEMQTLLAVDNIVRRDGALWWTPNDNILVADGGYTGADKDGSAGTNDWMYATPMVEVHMSPVQTRSLGEVRDNPGSMVDADINDKASWAQQDVIVLWDSHLAHAAAQVDIAV